MKNRSNESNLEQYWTPRDQLMPLLVPLMNLLSDCITMDHPGGCVMVEPFNGDGGLTAFSDLLNCHVITNDIDPNLSCDYHCDLMDKSIAKSFGRGVMEEIGDRPHFVFSNPPYTVHDLVWQGGGELGEGGFRKKRKYSASDFVQGCMDIFPGADAIVMLLRLNFLEKCKLREELLDGVVNRGGVDWVLRRVIITPRFKFMNTNGNDAMTTCFCVWVKLDPANPQPKEISWL